METRFIDVFCDEDTPKYALAKPFLIDGKACATDGRAAVMVMDDMGLPPNDSDLKYPPVDKLFKAVGEGELHPIPETTKPAGLDHRFELNVDDFHFDCEYDRPTYAIHKSSNDKIEFQGLQFKRMYIWKILQCPGLKGGRLVSTSDSHKAFTQALYFEFETGYGILMPLAELEPIAQVADSEAGKS